MTAAEGYDELVARANQSAQSGGTPPHWGRKVELEVGETFCGRHRGEEAGGKSGAKLLWDLDGHEVFIWTNTALDREYMREQPSVGDSIAISRAENYRTKFDDADGEPSGLSFGVAVGKNDAPLPGAEDDLGEPF